MRKKDPDLMNRIYDFVNEYYQANEHTPTMQEIGDGVGIARSTAYKYLVAMDQKGLLEYKNGVMLTASMRKTMVGRESVDVVGSIPCGEPMSEEANVIMRTSLPTAIFGKGPFYILYASGDSMTDAGIEDGDLLVIRQHEELKVGDIVVALDENNENTLKRYEGYDKEKNKFVLGYQNGAVYGDKKIYLNEMTCQGVLRYVIKAM